MKNLLQDEMNLGFVDATELGANLSRPRVHGKKDKVSLGSKVGHIVQGFSTNHSQCRF